MKTKRNILVLLAAMMSTGLFARHAFHESAATAGTADFSNPVMRPQLMVNTYYFEHDGFYYASRIRRFNRPMYTVRVGYYDPFFTDMYWYGGGYYSDASIYWGMPYWYYSPNYVQVVYHTPLFYWNDYYDPYFSGVYVRFHIGYPRYYTPYRDVYYVGYGGIWGPGVVYRTRVHYHYHFHRPAVYHTWVNTRPVYYSSNATHRSNLATSSRATYHTREQGFTRATAVRRGTEAVSPRTAGTATSPARRGETVRTSGADRPSQGGRPVLNPADIRHGGTPTTPTDPKRVTPSVTRRGEGDDRGSSRERVATAPSRTDNRTTTAPRTATPGRQATPAPGKSSELKGATPPKSTPAAPARTQTTRKSAGNERAASVSRSSTKREAAAKKSETRSTRSSRSEKSSPSKEKTSGRRR